jgi:hypothetical protein
MLRCHPRVRCSNRARASAMLQSQTACVLLVGTTHPFSMRCGHVLTASSGCGCSVTVADISHLREPSPPSPAPTPSSLESLAAESMSFDGDDIESIDAKVQKALDYPCVADLKNGPCGGPFVNAFSCFLRSTKEEKGSDCVKLFITLQDCIKENPEAFSKQILEVDWFICVSCSY